MMNLTSLSLILTGVILNAMAQLLLKAGTNQLGIISFTKENWFSMLLKIGLEWHIVCGLGCYAISVVVWIMALSRVEVGIAYPMLSIGYIINLGLAWWLFGEVITLNKIFGIVSIIFGVYLINLK